MSDFQLEQLLLRIIAIMIAAKIGGYLAERIKQPAVLGELIFGAIIGPSLLGIIPADPGEVITFLSEIGIIILLFYVGLESNIFQLMKVGISSLLVACIGVFFPFLFGYLFFINMGSSNLISLFVGATLTATSVGVTLRVLSEMNKVSSNEGKIILGAAVIDDVIGLIILSVMVGISTTGTVSYIAMIKIIVLSLVFLIGTLYVGIKFTPSIFKVVHKMNIKRTFIIGAFIFAIFMSYLADLSGLATIVGAFAAGLILETTEHKEHIKERLKPLVDLFVPIFFIMAGVMLDIKTFFDMKVLWLVLIITIIAIIGKIISGLGVINVKASRIAVGIGMIPRGEVGLIFATYGLTNKIIGSDLYSTLVAVIILSTFITPPLLKYIMEKIDNYSG